MLNAPIMFLGTTYHETRRLELSRAVLPRISSLNRND